MKEIEVCEFVIGAGKPFTLVSGPCVIESEEIALRSAEQLKKLTDALPVQLIYKSSYDKANRSSIHSYRGPGLEEGLRILEKVKTRFEIPIFTDVHTPKEAAAAGEVCDVLQIPALLCRQTDLLVAAGKTQKPINVKKGQFMSPWDMKNVINKLSSTGNETILLTERGTSFGYQNLISDMRSIQIMQSFGFPVLFDATHSVQLPGALNDQSGGQREFIPLLARAALAAGTNGIYAEAHPEPSEALCDAACMLSMDTLGKELPLWLKLYETIQESA